MFSKIDAFLNLRHWITLLLARNINKGGANFAYSFKKYISLKFENIKILVPVLVFAMKFVPVSFDIVSLSSFAF